MQKNHYFWRCHGFQRFRLGKRCHHQRHGRKPEANKTPINTVKNAQAIAQLPAGLQLAVPGKFTVAIAGLSQPPLTVFADDNKTLIGSEADIARLVADSLGLELNVVPTSWEDWPLGVASGKYDAAISNITVTKARKEKFDFATYRKDSLGFTLKPAVS